jgi:hypothetical protein
MQKKETKKNEDDPFIYKEGTRHAGDKITDSMIRIKNPFRKGRDLYI